MAQPLLAVYIFSFFLALCSGSKIINQTTTTTINFPCVEGVGKSSLISTFVSRYFSEVVPGIMTRVRLPPDPNSSCITTIVDSQGADSALLSAVAAMSLSRDGGTGTSGGEPDSLSSFFQRAEASRMSSGGTSAGNTSAGAGATASSTTSANSITATTTTTATSAGIDNVDSIILVYDLDRVETFFRLENHWLPLIERCYNGEVSNSVLTRYFQNDSLP